LSYRTLSNRDANRENARAFLHETFSAFYKARLVGGKSGGIFTKRAPIFFCPEFPLRNQPEKKDRFHKRDTRIPASGSGLFRSLWRKNCSLLESVSEKIWGEDPLVPRGVRAYNNNIVCGLKFFLEEKEVTPIIKRKRATHEGCDCSL
jgi:hypothetical protein